MNTKIFKNFTKNRHIEHSTFDMGFKNLGTANFGALQVKGILPVMPDDKWSIGLDSLTKVDPMSAPAFTRIMQNTYAFYVPNACVWSYWNDYISNGSAFLDTYGNNATNQDITDMWRPPCTSVMDLQLITKIADGWSIPIWTLTPEQVSIVNEHLHNFVDHDEPRVFLAPDVVTNDYRLNLYWWHFLQALVSPRVPASLFSFAYYAPVFEFEFVTEQGRSRISSYTLKSLTVGGSFETWSNFQNLVFGNNFTAISNNFPFGTTTDPTEYGDNNRNVLQQLALNFIHFCDPAALPDSKSDAPFFLRRCSVKSIRETPVNSYLYEMNLPDGFDQADTDGYLKYYSSKRGMYGKTYQVDSGVTSEGGYDVTIYNVFQVMSSALRDFDISFDSLPYVFRFFYVNWSSCLALLDNSSQSLHGLVNNPGVEFSYIPDSTVVNPTLLHASENPFSFHYSQSYGYEVRQLAAFGEFQQWITTQFLLPYFKDNNNIILDFLLNGNPYGTWFDPESFSCGWSSFGFLVYNCIQARQSIERMNIPVDSFTPKRFSDYNQEFLESIPWFGVSKIYGEYFRNKATSTAELDYCKTNGIAFNDSARVAYYTDSFNQYENVPQWIVDMCEKQNSWVIPFETAPKSGVGASLEIAETSSASLVERATQNFHYFDIVSSQDLFSVLTGYGLKYRVLQKMLDVTEWTSTGDASTFYVVNLFLERIYLPSYYNGLLHQRYQNFNQDYFSSSLFDAMSGANQVNVPTTITELRSAERKQTFWERLAMNRSFAAFSEKFFGTKPYHDDIDKPLMLGSMHTRLEIGEVVQTSQTSASSSQGTRSGLGAGRGSSGLVSRKFSEYGYIILLQSHTVEVQYFQGLERHWTPKESFLDYPFFDFVAIGNQPIYQRELNYGISPEVTERRPVPFLSQESNYVAGYPHTYSKGYNNPTFISEISRSNFVLNDGVATVRYNLPKTVSVTDHHSDIFGYVSRFSDWKFKFDELHGEFRNTLDYWHTFRRFFIRPLLSHEFVNWEFMADDNELNRLFNVLENDISDKFKVYLRFNCKVRRALPYICQPSM